MSRGTRNSELVSASVGNTYSQLLNVHVRVAQFVDKAVDSTGRGLLCARANAAAVGHRDQHAVLERGVIVSVANRIAFPLIQLSPISSKKVRYGFIFLLSNSTYEKGKVEIDRAATKSVKCSVSSPVSSAGPSNWYNSLLYCELNLMT